MRGDWLEYLKWRDEMAGVLDPTYYTIQWLDKEVLEGRAVLLSTPDAAVLYEIKHYPTGARDLHGLLAVGKLDDIVSVLIPACEEQGRSLGCVGALIQSREGWARTLKSHGYETYQLSVRKAL